MRSREAIAWGAVIGMLIAAFSLKSETRGPGPSETGEATVSVLGVVVDRVEIPAGSAKLPTDRIMRGVLTAMIGSAVAFGCAGGLLGAVLGRSRIKPK